MVNTLSARLRSLDTLAKIKVLGVARIFAYYQFSCIIVNIFTEPLDLIHIIMYLVFLNLGLAWLIVHNLARRKKNYKGWL